MTTIFSNQTYSISEPSLGLNLEDNIDGIREERLLYENGATRSLCYIKENHLHGPSRFFSVEGTLLSETWFWMGQRQGICRFFYPSGAIYAKLFYRDNRKTGRHEYFYENGQVKTIEEYDRGALSGEIALYWPNGQCKRRCHFINGKRKEADQCWSEDGTPLV